MNEGMNKREVKETIPTIEEILSLVRQLTNKELTVTRKREDGKGLYLLDIIPLGISPRLAAGTL